MDAVTYPDDDVIDLLTSNFACYKPPIADNKDLASSYGVKWTPGLVWLTPEGEKVHHNVGYFAPTELMAEATYAQGQGAVRAGDWKQALENFESVIARSRSDRNATRSFRTLSVSRATADKGLRGYKTESSMRAGFTQARRRHSAVFDI
jgi:hypothetical protein